ncbi:MAG: hypothetical protein ACK4QW_03615 [Alphaproteobacteria bacterium]
MVATASDRLEASAPPPAGPAPAAGAPVREAPAPARPASPKYDWGVAVYAGKSSPSNFTSLFYSPWRAEFENTYLLNLSVSRRLFSLGEHVDTELEVNVGKRFGDDDSWEFASALFVRYDGFPWNHRVHTTVGVAVLGPSFATGISETERRKAGNDNRGSKLLNFFSPEITLADPDRPEFAYVFRLHHRSGVFGLFDGVSGGSNFPSVGMRYRF